MMTTANAFRPEQPVPEGYEVRQVPKPTAAERMAKARAAKAAKAAARLGARAWRAVEATTTGGATPAQGNGPSALGTQTIADLTTILRELGTMFGYSSPRGHELVQKALRLLESNQ